MDWKRLLAHLEENLNDYNREELFLQWALEKLAQTWKIKGKGMAMARWGVWRTCQEKGSLGMSKYFWTPLLLHQCTIMFSFVANFHQKIKISWVQQNCLRKIDRLIWKDSQILFVPLTAIFKSKCNHFAMSPLFNYSYSLTIC